MIMSWVNASAQIPTQLLTFYFTKNCTELGLADWSGRSTEHQGNLHRPFFPPAYQSLTQCPGRAAWFDVFKHRYRVTCPHLSPLEGNGQRILGTASHKGANVQQETGAEDRPPATGTKDSEIMENK